MSEKACARNRRYACRKDKGARKSNKTRETREDPSAHACAGKATCTSKTHVHGQDAREERLTHREIISQRLFVTCKIL